MSNNDFDVNFDISNTAADASEDELNSREVSKLVDRAHEAEARCTELEGRLAKHTVRASSLGAMKEEASKAWLRISTLERECGALARKKESLEENIIDLTRDLNNARGEAMTLRDAHGYKCYFSWEPAPS